MSRTWRISWYYIKRLFWDIFLSHILNLPLLSESGRCAYTYDWQSALVTSYISILNNFSKVFFKYCARSSFPQIQIQVLTKSTRLCFLIILYFRTRTCYRVIRKLLCTCKKNKSGIHTSRVPPRARFLNHSTLPPPVVVTGACESACTTKVTCLHTVRTTDSRSTHAR